jgi:hypothetical protein
MVVFPVFGSRYSRLTDTFIYGAYKYASFIYGELSFLSQKSHIFGQKEGLLLTDF